MKKLLSGILATSLVFSLSSTAFAAVSRPVIDIDHSGYITEDGVVDINNPVYKVQGGKTVYFPFFSGSDGTIESLKKIVADKKAAFETAKTALATATTAKDAAEAKLSKLQADYNAAKAAYDKAVGNTRATTPTLEQLQTALKNAQAELATKVAQIGVIEKDINDSLDEVKALEKAVTDAKALVDAHISLMKSFPFVSADAIKDLTDDDLKAMTDLYATEITSLGGTVATASTTEIKTSYDPLPTVDGYTAMSKEDKVTTLNKLLVDLKAKKNLYNSKMTARDTTKPNLDKSIADATQVKTNLETEKATLTQAVNEAKAAVEAHDDAKALKSAMDAAKATLDTYSQSAEYKTAKDNFAKAEAAKNNAETDLKTAETNLSTAQAKNYKYVNEADAVSRTSITSRWETGKQYVAKTSIIKKKTNHDTTNLAEKYAYFVALETKPTGSTTDKELIGEIRLRRSGTDSFDLTLNVGMELGYSKAEQESVIGTKEQMFEVGAGFAGVSDDVLEFEADDYSRFEVNTIGQGKLVLSMDTEYDSKIANAFPSANINFWNGNYGSFNRIGKLYLNNGSETKGYVYAIGKDGKLSTPKHTYDTYEDAYVIDTRVLGRYMVSDKKLDINKYNAGIDKDDSSSSGGSGSSSGGSSSGGGNTGKPNPPTGTMA